MAIKTVKCPECGAEQAIMRDDDGNMNCVFCGHPMDLPEYEEGEGMDYTYEEKIPEQVKEEPIGEKIVASFVLNEEEVGNAFMISGKMKERKWILYVETVLLALIGCATAVMNIISLQKGKTPGFSDWLIVAICIFMIPFIWISPQKTKKKIIRNATSGNQLTLSIYENLINIHIEGREESEDWQQLFDGSFGVIQGEGLIVLTLHNGQILVIPERSLKDEEIEIVKTRLQTKPDAE